MLSRAMYISEYIQELYKRTGNDPALLERVIYAFGLLEAIKKVGLTFCFKGGSALLLMLEHPRRLSTDIDIIVEPGTDIDDYISKAGDIFPFIDAEEHIRIGQNNIEKRHFQFKYHSPHSGRDVVILLDVLFENIQYSAVAERPIRNELLLTEGDDLTVTVPDANSILGDKLTAFAPHTTGIPFGVSKELEIVKQLFDCSSLFDVMNDYNAVRDSYNHIVKSEMEYRGLFLSPDEVLKDTIKGCLCVASRGQMYADEYSYFKDGIARIRNHILGGKFSGEIAGVHASKVLFLASSMLVGCDSVTKISETSDYSGQRIKLPKPKSFSYLRIVDPIAYGYVAEAGELLQDTEYEK